MTAKERIVCAVLNDLWEKNKNNDVFEDLMKIRLHTEGYESVLNDYAKQIIKLLESGK